MIMTEWQYFCMLMREEPGGALIYFAAIGVYGFLAIMLIWDWLGKKTGGKDGTQPE
jgi:hypothetical protein